MHYIRLLRNNPDFARLWGAQVISLLGDWFSTIVLSALIVTYTEGTAYQGLAISGFLLARLLPPLLITPISGVLIDRFNRKYILILSDISRTLVVLLLVVTATSPDRLWTIYLFTIIQFLLSAVFEPGRNAIMPSVLDHDDLVIGNTLSSVTWSVMLAVGAIIGGIIASQLGITAALIIDSATFLVSAFLISQINLRPLDDSTIEIETPVDKSQRTFREGLRYLMHHPATAAAIFVKGGLSIGSLDAVLIFYATQLFVIGEGGTTSMAIIWSAFGVGAIVGPLLTNRISDGTVRNLRRLIIIGFLLVIGGWFFIGAAPSLELVVIAAVIRAMGGSINWTYSSVIIQKVVPDEYLGRMFALDMAGFQLMQGISTVVVGLLLDSIGSENVRQVVIWTGYASFIPLAIWLYTVYRLDRNTPEHQPMAVGD